MALLVGMPVVRVGKVLVRMGHRFVAVPMHVAHAGRDGPRVLVQVVRVVLVLMLVLDRLVEMAMPVVLGVLLGSMQGARVLGAARPQRLRRVFMWVIVALALEMLFNGVSGRL